ncbi:nucleobindin-1 [Osmerus eperlanus]|uniref:nucleobindin-1 n=1 Tax=Osmerus eperlanus TaxID=29151 RepID=UPI002E0E9027
MYVDPRWLLLLSVSLEVWAVPIDHKVPPDTQQPPEDNVDTGLYYDRYLREVIEVLETDPHFREKLQTANTEDIKVRLPPTALSFISTLPPRDPHRLSDTVSLLHKPLTRHTSACLCCSLCSSRLCTASKPASKTCL